MYLRYLWYVLRHRWFVFLACCSADVPWRGLVHDLSKFRSSEFIPYARYFYGTQPVSPVKQEAFDKAWLLHQHRNAHHWQHWVLREDDGGTKLVEMPDAYLREMVSDWVGAGRSITGKYGGTRKWINANIERIQLAPDDWRRVEVQLLYHEA